MPEQTPTYPVAEPSNAEQYRSRYMQTHLERVRIAIEQARSEAWTEYLDENKRQQYLDRQIELQRTYVQSLEQSLMDYQVSIERARNDPAAKRAAQAGLTDGLELAVDAVYKGGQLAGADADRRMRAKEIMLRDWGLDRSTVGLVKRTVEELQTSLLGKWTARDVASATIEVLNDDRVRAAYDAMGGNSDETPRSRKRAFAVNLVRELQASAAQAHDAAGNPIVLDTDTVEELVARGLRLDPEEVNPDLFEASRVQAAKDLERAAIGGGAGRLYKLADTAAALTPEQQAASEQRATEAPEGSPAEQLVANAEQWTRIRADLADDGRLNLSIHPQSARGQQAQEQLIKDRTAYEGARATADDLSTRDQQWFDDFFLQRVATTAKARGDLGQLQKERAAAGVPRPTEELIKERAGAIYAPQRPRPRFQTPEQEAQFRRETEERQHRGTLPAIRERQANLQQMREDFESLPEDRKILLAAAFQAGSLSLDAQPSDLAVQLYQQIRNGILERKNLVQTAADYHRNEPDSRDELVRDVFYLDMQDWRAQQFRPSQKPPKPPEKPEKPAESVWTEIEATTPAE